ncbi:MAG: S9 family peptidase [Acidobacteriia bacterium]|nr:S9 family peptidase [Terriglobia bacterium]
MRRFARFVPVVVFILGLSAAVGPASAQSSKRPLTLDDLARIRSVGDPQVSPDGKWVAYTVGAVDVEKDRRDTDLWMVSWDGSQQIRLTATSDTSESAPRWSPDNRYLAFLTSRGDEEEKKKGAQVWLLNRAGGEAQKLTDIKGGVSEYAWAPDSKRLILVVHDPDPAAEPEKLEGWKRKTRPPIVIDRYHFKEDREGYLGLLHTHLSLFEVETRKAEVLTSGRFDEQFPAWSPDGRYVAFVSNRTSDPDRNEDTNVFVIEAKPGSEPRQLTTYAGPDGGRPSWSPDGRFIAYVQGDEVRYTAYNLNKLAVVPVAGGQSRVLTIALDRGVSGPFIWTSDGKELLFVVADDRASYLARMPVAGGAVDKITAGRRVVSGISRRDDGTLALLTATASEVSEVHALENGTLRRLSHQNDALFSELQLGTTEDFTSRSKDGTEVHGLIVKPYSYTPDRKYPALLLIHGGPNGQDEHSFSFDRQFFAANGYAVISVNYRGSSGRGTAYQRAIYADWGNKEVVDLLGAVDYAVASGIADPERLGIGGWSYGGILTDYTIVTDPRFKAAVSGASSALQLSMYGSDQYILQYENELGVPWKTKDLWLKLSYPFFQVDRIKTPTLFLSGDRDFNVPTIGVEQMYQALKSLGVDTQLIIYPGQFHGITVPSYMRDRLQRYLDWFNKYLKK